VAPTGRNTLTSVLVVHALGSRMGASARFSAITASTPSMQPEEPEAFTGIPGQRARRRAGNCSGSSSRTLKLSGNASSSSALGGTPGLVLYRSLARA